MPFRSLIRDRASVGAALLLACGLGAAAAIFTLVNALVFKPLPFPDPDRLVAARVGGRSWSPFMLEAIEREATAFAGLAGVQARTATLTGERRPLQIRLESVSASYFALLGARPVVGRLFTADEDRRGVPPAGVAVLGHGLALRRFGSAEGAVGESLMVDGRRLTIVGVLPASFGGVTTGTDLWSPLAATRWLEGSDAEPERITSRWFEVIGRIGPGFGLDEARARFAVDARRGIEQLPNWQAMFGDPRMSLVPLAETRSIARLTTVAIVLLAGSGLLVLMAVSNLAGLQIARAAGRRREFGVRLALGATRWSLVRLIARDAAIVVCAGVAGALALRGGIIDLLIAMRPAMPGFGLAAADPFTSHALAFDARLAAALVGSAVFAWLAIVFWPAMSALRADFDAAQGRVSLVTGSRRTYAARALIAAELAVATVLVIGAGLMARSALVLAAHDRGFSPRGVWTARLAMPSSGYDPAATASFYEQLVTNIRATPGVRSAGIASCAPGVGRCRQTNVRRVDGAEFPEGKHPTVGAHFVTTGLFRTIGARIVAGRDFDGRDTPGAAPTAIISDALASRLWPGQPAVGRRLALYFANGYFTEDREVVGIVRSIEYDAVEVQTPGDVYLPASQAAWSGIVFVRTDPAVGRPDEIVDQSVAAMDPSIVVFDAATMEQRLAAGLGDERFVTVTLGVYAAAALVLAGLGVYTMVRLSVARRTREFGIRVAIGATRGRITRDVVSSVVLPGMAGTAAGVLAAWWLVQALATVLYGVTPRDPVTFGFAVVLLMVSVITAAAGPALQAARTDPISALRTDV
jgi:predicted permease